ncbi:MAG: serine/threonine-protein kinase, partial [Myxococcota bacterium]
SLVSDDVPGYEIVRQVGRGGLGVVYAVREQHTGTLRALKVLHAGLREDQRPRFVQEAQVQMALRHENIVSVLHLVELDQTIGLVMELVEGETLFMRLENGALPEDEAIVLFRGIVAGVAEIHANNIVHRDLKPANFLIAHRDERDVPMVTDFGLVRLLDVEPRTQIGVFLGTPGYAPPEQHLDARSVTRAADVWSLGVMFYEMLTGRLPFVVPAPFGVPSYGAVYDNRRLPPRWRPLVARMLQPDPDRRLATATDVLRALDERIDPADEVTIDL